MIFITVIGALTVTGCVVLFLFDRPEQAVELPIVVGTLLPILVAQLHTVDTVHAVDAKVDHLLNGGGQENVERAIEAKLPDIAAAATGNPSPSTAEGATDDHDR